MLSEGAPSGGAVGAVFWSVEEDDEDVSAAVAVSTAPVVVPAESTTAIASAVSLFLFFIAGLLLYVRHYVMQCLPESGYGRLSLTLFVSTMQVRRDWLLDLHCFPFDDGIIPRLP